MISLPWSAFSQTSSWNVNNEVLESHWQIQSSDKVNAEGEKVSTTAFKPSGWYAAKIPNSTLGTLVEDGVFKNIYFNFFHEKDI